MAGFDWLTDAQTCNFISAHREVDPRSGWLINTGPTRQAMERITCWRDEIAGAGNWRTLEDWISESGKWKKGGKKASNIFQSNFIFVENVLFFIEKVSFEAVSSFFGSFKVESWSSTRVVFQLIAFFYIGTRPLFLKWKFRPITTLTLHLAVLWDAASLDACSPSVAEFEPWHGC